LVDGNGLLSTTVPAINDSRDDSQVGGRLRTITNDYGLTPRMTERLRTLPTSCGWQFRGLQNRLRASKIEGNGLPFTLRVWYHARASLENLLGHLRPTRCLRQAIDIGSFRVQIAGGEVLWQSG
jgi:hypothetical protein